MTCRCQSVEVQTYANQIVMPAPPWWSRNTICLDWCVAAEVRWLWSLGIVTLGCCCGHGGSVPAYIQVRPDFSEAMLAMGYRPLLLNGMPEGVFIPAR